MQNALYRNMNYLIHKRITYVKTFVQFMSEQMLLYDSGSKMNTGWVLDCELRVADLRYSACFKIN
jgi:hypothetical protein